MREDCKTRSRTRWSTFCPPSGLCHGLLRQSRSQRRTVRNHRRRAGPAVFYMQDPPYVTRSSAPSCSESRADCSVVYVVRKMALVGDALRRGPAGCGAGFSWNMKQRSAHHFHRRDTGGIVGDSDRCVNQTNHAAEEDTILGMVLAVFYPSASVW